MEKRERKSRFKREPLDKQVNITPRDFEILKAIYDFRLLNTQQIQKLMQGSNQVISRRLEYLFHAGFLDRPKAQIIYYSSNNRPIVSSITNKGARLLIERGIIPQARLDLDKNNSSIKQQFITHTLLIADIVIAIMLDCKVKGLRFIPPSEILDNSIKMKDYKGRANVFWDLGEGENKKRVYPDYTFGIEYKDGLKSYFFLEADTGEMRIALSGKKQTSIGGKIDAYRLTFASKIHEEKFGIKHFRVLFITDKEPRAKNMVKEVYNRTENHGSNMFLFHYICESFLKEPLSAELLTGKGQIVKMEN